MISVHKSGTWRILGIFLYEFGVNIPTIWNGYTAQGRIYSEFYGTTLFLGRGRKTITLSIIQCPSSRHSTLEENYYITLVKNAYYVLV